MRRDLFAISLIVLMPAYVVGQDLGTPVITPPILSGQQVGSQQLLVPPTPAQAPTSGPSSSSSPDAASAEQAVESVRPAPAVTRTSDKQTFADWTLECFDPAFDEGACQIEHRVTSGDASQVLMVFAVAAKSSEGPVQIQVALPLGIALPPGIGLSIGGGYQSRVPVQKCTPQGCIVEGVGSDELMTAMKRELSGQITVDRGFGQQANLPFSLKGFAAAFEAMLAREK